MPNTFFQQKINTNSKLWVKTKLTLFVASFIMFIVQPLQAQEQEWWFDIEVILFERNLDTSSIAEKFKESEIKTKADKTIDLLTPYLNPDLSYLRAGLDFCRSSKRLAVAEQYAKDFAFPEVPVQPDDLTSSAELEQALDVTQIISPLADDQSNLSQSEPQTETVVSDIVTEAPEQFDQLTTDEMFAAENINEQADKKNIEVVLIQRPPIEVTFIEWQAPNILPCAYAEQVEPTVDSLNNNKPDWDKTLHVPPQINGVEWHNKGPAFLLPQSSMFMTDLYNSIKKQRDISPLLHKSWRQEVKFGRDKAQTFRLFAGENFAQEFDLQGNRIPEATDSLLKDLKEYYIPEQELALLSEDEKQLLLDNLKSDEQNTEQVKEDLFAKIYAALEDNTPINPKIELNKNKITINTIDKLDSEQTPIWQLDGKIKVYLRNVGRVPYLHIDGNLDYRYPIFEVNQGILSADNLDNLAEQTAITQNQLQQPNALRSVTFNQLRRVVSKQVHYFDHPLFGMIVRINRFKWPVEPEESELEDPPN